METERDQSGRVDRSIAAQPTDGLHLPLRLTRSGCLELVEQSLRVYGLHQVLIETSSSGAADLLFLPVTGQRDQAGAGELPVLSESTRDRESIHTGETNITPDHLRPGLARHVEPGGSRIRHFHLVAVGLQQVAQTFSRIPV